jgi:DNA replicative helicase MCM subunit Mcm2 (Cdc46/Mcm family)
VNDSVFDDIEAPIACEKCGHAFKQKMKGFTQREIFYCPSCGQDYSFKPEDLEKVKVQLEKLQNMKIEL